MSSVPLCYITASFAGLQDSLGCAVYSGVSHGLCDLEVACRNTKGSPANGVILCHEGREDYFLINFYFLKHVLKGIQYPQLLKGAEPNAPHTKGLLYIWTVFPLPIPLNILWTSMKLLLWEPITIMVGGYEGF